MRLVLTKVFGASAIWMMAATGTGYAYSPADPHISLGVGELHLEGDGWTTETSYANKWSLNFGGFDGGIVAMTFSLNGFHSHGHYTFPAESEPVNVDLTSSLSLRYDVCYKVFNAGNACLALAPTIVELRNAANTRTMGWQGFGLGWETDFANGIFARADAERYFSWEKIAGEKRRFAATAYWLALGYKFSAFEKSK